MNILAIENSTAHFSAAIKTKKTVIQSSVFSLNTSDEFIPVFDFLFKQAGITISEIDLFVMGTGPGSFTGLRTSLSIIKGFFIGLKKPCLGIAGYRALTRQYSSVDKPCAVIFDAKKNKVYGGVYRIENGKVVRMIEEGVYELEDFLINRCATDYLFAGESVKFIDRIRDVYPFANIATNNTYPEPRFLLEEAEAIYNKEDLKLYTPDNIKLLYIHPDTCNVRI